MRQAFIVGPISEKHRPLTDKQQLIDALKATASDVKTDDESCEQYGQDWTRFHRPAPLAVAFPRTTQDVIELVNFARAHQIGLVPSGGRTGLSAAAVALNGEIVVSFDRMATIQDFDATNRTVRCGPGVVTQSLQEFAEEKGLLPGHFASAARQMVGLSPPTWCTSTSFDTE